MAEKRVGSPESLSACWSSSLASRAALISWGTPRSCLAMPPHSSTSRPPVCSRHKTSVPSLSFRGCLSPVDLFTFSAILRPNRRGGSPVERTRTKFFGRCGDQHRLLYGLPACVDQRPAR